MALLLALRAAAIGPFKGNAIMINGNEKIEGAEASQIWDGAKSEGKAIDRIAPADRAADAPEAEAAAPIGKAAKKAAKAAAPKKPALIRAAGMDAPKKKKGLQARIAKQDDGKAKFEAAKKDAKAAQSRMLPGSDAGRDAEFHFSGLAHNMPSAEDIEKAQGLCKRMIGRDLARYKDALSGKLPEGEFDGAPIDLNLQTHAGYKGKWKALKALIDAGDLAALEGWNGGLGIRQNSSSSKPLGRFHQCAILALRAKAAKKASRAAKKEGAAHAEGAPA